MNLKELVIDAEKTIGRECLLVDVVPAYEYKDGRRTETVTGYKYEIAMPEHAFDKISIRIDGQQRMQKPDGYARVKFEGLEMHLYWSKDGYQVAATAKGVHVIKNDAA